jgi:nucleotide-binding universal stress UspA family protein
MFKRIAVVFDDSPEALHALNSAMSLPKTLDAEVQMVVVVTQPSAYTGYVLAEPNLPQALSENPGNFYTKLQETPIAEGQRHEVEIRTNLSVGEEFEAVVDFLNREQTDLLGLGAHRHGPRFSRLWNIVFTFQLEAHCSILGIH